MYQNKVTLIGFLGSDTEVRSANNPSFTTFSLATKSSSKDKNSNQYISHTEWHRRVVFGKLSEFAKMLTKGAQVQVEVELRSRRYTSKKTVTEQRIWGFASVRFCSSIAQRSLCRMSRRGMNRERPLRPLRFLRGSRPNSWASIDQETCYELRVDSSISSAH